MIAQRFYNEKFSIKNVYDFISLILITGKTEELISFIIWEIKYLLGFYKHQYLSFNDEQALISLKDDMLINDFVDISYMYRLDINWSKIYIDNTGTIYGNTMEHPDTLFSYKNNKLTLLHTFPDTIPGLFISKMNDIFVCSGGIIYKSKDGGLTFKNVLEYTSPRSCFRHNNSFTEDDEGNMFVGEYISEFVNKKWHFGAYIYYSNNGGDNWQKIDFLWHKGINKHIHLIKWSKNYGGLIMTDGDNKKKMWINKSKNFRDISNNPASGWCDMTVRHINKGGYTSMVETKDEIILGTDYQGGTNFIMRTKDMFNFEEYVVPPPYRRCILNNMSIIGNDGNQQIWATLYGSFRNKDRSLLMMSSDNGKNWTRIIEYDGTLFYIEVLNNSQNNFNQAIISIKGANRQAATFLFDTGKQ